ncbi:MAG: TIGR00159 family protein [Clostridiales bacterium]|nr:TIGR00159 family protein [Clostridiales bacterium]
MTAFLQFCVNTLGYLRLMTVSDLIDIAILSFVFYKCIGIFQRTNAAKVAKALLIIVVAMWISYQFNLNAINFILSKAVELGLLALVVIFQPEIRRFLEKVGSNSVSGFSRYFRSEAPVTDLEQAIAETVEAYAELSKSKIGALMVFERETDLSHIIASGTPFQSTVTSELLKNLFYPKAPLHDGAVVVRRGKIVAAACMLPMSESMNLSKDLGMRHRAGLGMSERSDAVVAVVSEETGAISVMIRGTLRRHLSPETLGRILSNELLPREGSFHLSTLMIPAQRQALGLRWENQRSTCSARRAVLYCSAAPQTAHRSSPARGSRSVCPPGTGAARCRAAACCQSSSEMSGGCFPGAVRISSGGALRARGRNWPTASSNSLRWR